MTIKRNLSIAAGLLIAVAGAGFGAKNTVDYLSKDRTPAIERNAELHKEFSEAIRKLDSIPETERMDYIPQQYKQDYSVSQAHSRVEHAVQRLDSARAALNESARQPEVREYIDSSNRAFFGFVSGFSGLVLAYAGFRKR